MSGMGDFVVGGGFFWDPLGYLSVIFFYFKAAIALNFYL